MTDTYVAEFVARHEQKATGTIVLWRALDTVREYAVILAELEAEREAAAEELYKIEEQLNDLDRSIDQTRTRIAIYEAMAEAEDAMRRRLPAVRRGDPKESKLQRTARLEAERLATRREVHWCDRCNYRLTSRASGLCSGCEFG